MNAGKVRIRIIGADGSGLIAPARDSLAMACAASRLAGA